MSAHVYWDGDPYELDSDGEYVEQHHGGGTDD